MKTNKELIAAIDAGTTGVRCCIFDFQGNEISGGYYKVPAFYPKPGYVEQDADTIIELAYKAVAAAVASHGLQPEKIAGLCITGQRNSFVPTDKDGRFLTRMFIWQDQRGSEVHSWMLARLQAHKMSLSDLYRVNGQPFGTFQSGNKAIWLRRFRQDIYAEAWKLVTPIAFLTKAFGAEGYFEEKNDAGCWLAADADTQKIDRDLCSIFDLDPAKFLEAVAPGTKVGTVSGYASSKTGLVQGTPIYMGSGDQQCGSLGAGNYGTSDIITVCMGTAGLCSAYSPKPVRHPDGLCNVQGHPAGGYTVEGHSSSCMSSFAWARDMLFSAAAEGTPGTDGEVNKMAEEAAKKAPAGANGVFFLPWLQGAECPHYDKNARGAFTGMTLATQKGDLIRAAMEGICFENRMMIETLLGTVVSPVKTLRLLGGAVNNGFWNQMQADIYGLPAETVTAKECTALGAGIIGAAAAGVYGDYAEAVRNMVHVRRRYLPDKDEHGHYNELYDVWNSCYEGLKKATGAGYVFE